MPAKNVFPWYFSIFILHISFKSFQKIFDQSDPLICFYKVLLWRLYEHMVTYICLSVYVSICCQSTSKEKYVVLMIIFFLRVMSKKFLREIGRQMSRKRRRQLGSLPCYVVSQCFHLCPCPRILNSTIYHSKFVALALWLL